MNDNDQKLNLPTGFEKMLFEGMIRAFFVGQSYMGSGGYMVNEPAPMGQVTNQVSQKITPLLVAEIIKQIDIEGLAKETAAKLDMKAIRAEVKKEVKEKLVKKITLLTAPTN